MIKRFSSSSSRQTQVTSVYSCMCAAVFMIGLNIGPSTSRADEPEYSGDIFDVTTIDRLEPDGPYNKIWEPYLVKWGSKQFVAAYGLQVTGKGDMGDIVCSITRDAGKTWGHRVMVFDHRQRNGTVQYAYNNAVLFRPPNQDVIWLFAMRAPMHYRDSENADLVAAYSADGGYSWHHVEIAMDYQGSLIIVAGIETVQRDGVTHYLLPAHRNSLRHDPHGDRRQFVLESQSLLHWKLAGYVPYPGDDPVFLHEGGIATTDNPGELKILMRTATMDRERPLDPPLAYSSKSNDGGRTWSIAKPEPELPNYRSKSFFGKNSDDTQICVYSDHVDRRGLYYKTRSVNGNWSEQREFYVADNRNSYPTLIEDKSGQWLAVWDSSDSPDDKRTAIRFGRIKSKPEP
ncbi:MAG: exo-alpha-sialidase [Planctomycetales bacterium]|nr:exo-alpha-sialidase [Planctomycetales bacterium]